MLVCALCRGGKGGKCVWHAAAAPLAAVGVPPSRAAHDGAADHPSPRNITRQEQMERLVSSTHSQPRRQNPPRAEARIPLLHPNAPGGAQAGDVAGHRLAEALDAAGGLRLWQQRGQAAENAARLAQHPC